MLLLDEPLSALDAAVRLTLRLEIRRIQRSLGIATMYITHDQEEALSISDRVAVMRDGRIEQLGTPEDIYTAPVNEYVARFVGQLEPPRRPRRRRGRPDRRVARAARCPSSPGRASLPASRPS